MRTCVNAVLTIVSRAVAIGFFVAAIEGCIALLELTESSLGAELGLFEWVESADLALAVGAGIVWHGCVMVVNRRRTAAAGSGLVQGEVRGGQQEVGTRAGTSPFLKSRGLEAGDDQRDSWPSKP